MYMQALECVVLGDNNVECYEVFMTMMQDVHSTLLPLSVDKDGLGRAEREKQQLLVASPPEGSIQANAGEDADNGDADSNCSGLGVHQKKRQRGRPTTIRDKAPYENHLKRSRFCTICRMQGHKCTTCP